MSSKPKNKDTIVFTGGVQVASIGGRSWVPEKDYKTTHKKLVLAQQAICDYVAAREAVLDYAHRYLESGGSPLTMPKRWHELDEIRQQAYEAMLHAVTRQVVT